MQTSQDKLQSTINKQLMKLKAITKKTTMMKIHPVKATGGESSSVPSISYKEIILKDHTNTVMIPPGSIRFPVSMLDVQVQVRQPVEVNLAQFLVNQLQMIQRQIAAELKDRELVTYNKNAQLIQQNAELTAGFQTKAVELRLYEEREQDLR